MRKSKKKVGKKKSRELELRAQNFIFSEKNANNEKTGFSKIKVASHVSNDSKSVFLENSEKCRGCLKISKKSPNYFPVFGSPTFAVFGAKLCREGREGTFSFWHLKIQNVENRKKIK